MHDPVRSIVIVGGGTAGWMAAAAASRFLNDGQRTITLVESDAIGTIGVGEATIPPIREFNARLGIDESEFLRETGATIKLGIEFVDWAALGDRYLHPFGQMGRDFEGIGFHHFWLKHRGRPEVAAIADYWLSGLAARGNRFAPPSPDPRSPLSQIAYAYHFDARLYAAFLRRRSEAHGVQRVEGRIVDVVTDGETGHVRHLLLDDGRMVAGDLFLDCSGFRSLLLGEALGVGYHDWSHWLACDRAMAVPTARIEPLPPYTRASAHGAGWQWRIPLQHRTGNGIVYASRFMDDEAARQSLLANLEGEPLADPRPIAFTAGVRDRLWEKNVVALGLAGGFLEPLESTSIHLIQTGLSKLFWLFPDQGFSPIERTEYNRLMRDAYDRIRDFIILHYKATARSDTPFWRAMQAMDVPDTLTERTDLFAQKARVRQLDNDLFSPQSWVAVMLGQGLLPDGYDPLVDAMDDERIIAAMAQLAQTYARAADAMPDHGAQIMRMMAKPD